MRQAITNSKFTLNCKYLLKRLKKQSLSKDASDPDDFLKAKETIGFNFGLCPTVLICQV